MCKEKNIQKVNPKKLYVELWILAQQSWLNQLGTIATIQNLKKKKKDKVAQQNGIIDVQRKNTRCTVQKHCTRIRAFIYKKKEYKSMIEKKKYILNKPKVL